MVKIYKQPFAHSGDTIAIPDALQPDGKMSSAEGWTNDYQLRKDNPDYKAVGRREMNGIFKEITEALGEMQVQGSASWSADGAPYPINAQTYHNGKQWLALRATSVEPTEGEDWTELFSGDEVTLKPWTPELSYVPYYINAGASADNFAVLLDVTGVTFPDDGYWFAMTDSAGIAGGIHLVHEDGDLVIKQPAAGTTPVGTIIGYGEVGGEILIRFEPWHNGERPVTIYDSTGEIFSDTVYVWNPDKSYIAANTSSEPAVAGKGAVTFKILSGVYTSLYEAKNALEEDVIASYTASVNNIPANATSNIFEITGTPTPLQWDALGGTVVNGDLVAFDSAGVPFVVDVTATDLSNYYTKSETDSALATKADKTLPINWLGVSTSTFLIEPEHAGKSLWVTANCVITVSAHSTLPTGFNCEILKADASLIVSVVASGGDIIRDGKSVIVSDASVFKTPSAGVIGLVGDVS